jgi:hypothetical protein
MPSLAWSVRVGGVGQFGGEQGQGEAESTQRAKRGHLPAGHPLRQPAQAGTDSKGQPSVCNDAPGDR